MHGARTGGPLLTVTLCLAITFGLSGCADEPSSAPESGSAPATSSQSDSQDAVQAPADPLDACGLLTTEQVGDFLGEAVTASPAGEGAEGSSCQFRAADDEAPLAVLSTVIETLYDGGFDGFLAEAQGQFADSTEQVTVAGIDGYLLTGSLEGNSATICFVLIDGIVVVTTLPGVEPEVKLRAQGLVELALGVG